jgi:hypothetical protein
MAMDPDVLHLKIRDVANQYVEKKKIIQYRYNTTSDGKDTQLEQISYSALPPDDDGWKAIVDSIAQAVAEEVIAHMKEKLEISQGQFSLQNGTMSNTLTGVTYSGGPATAVGGTIASETGTVAIQPGAVK